MNKGILDLKMKYNSFLEREIKAEDYLNRSTDEQYEKWVPEFNKIVRELSRLRKLIPNITDDEVLNGFKLNDV